MSGKKLVVPCKFFQEGRCSEGSRCRFLHLKKDQSKTGQAANNATSEPPNVVATCKFFAMGTCKFGDRCALRHSGPEPASLSPSSSKKTTSTTSIIPDSTTPKKGIVILTADGRRITTNELTPQKKLVIEEKPTDSIRNSVWNHSPTKTTNHGEDGKENRNSAMSSMFDQMSLFSSPPSVSSLFAAPSMAFGSELSAHVNSYIPLSHDSFPGFELSPPEPLTTRSTGPKPVSTNNNPVSYSNVASQGVVKQEPQNSAIPIKPPPPPPSRNGFAIGIERRRLRSQNGEPPTSLEGESANGMECSICFENPIEKRSRFGLLDCAHCFCLSCIRDWRSAGSGTQVKSCPQCRVVTHFVVPSSVWITDEAEKATLRELYKNNMSTIACRHFNFGDGSCPFGTSCHYAHLNRDGARQEITLRKFIGENEEMQIMTEVRLSDFFR